MTLFSNKAPLAVAISRNESLGCCQPAPGMQMDVDPGALEKSCGVSLESVEMKGGLVKASGPDQGIWA